MVCLVFLEGERYFDFFMNKRNELPDVRDGLGRKERIVLHCINILQAELGGRNVPTAMLYGRVVEYVDISVEELQSILQQLIHNKS
jgi:hypothetical protein